MKHLHLGDGCCLPPDAITSTFGVLAMRGAGKTNTAAVMAEEMFAAGLPFVVVDPVGNWYGLRASADGKADGGLAIPIFGGKHGDIPLERGAGVMIADLLIEKRLSCVLDLSEFQSEGDKKHFLLDFARRLYQKNENPLHLFLEEADDYIPQKPMRDEAYLLRAWENIVRRGRSRGLGMTMITQRSASINKNVLTQAATLIAMRTTGPQDIAAIEAWVKYNQASLDILKSLPTLKDGEAWVISPYYLKATSRHQIRRRHTFDSGATPKNFAGHGKPMATLADVDLAALQNQMAATIERAKAEDPRALRAEIARLKAELARKPAPSVTVEKQEVPVLKDGQLARIEKLVRSFDVIFPRFKASTDELLNALNKVGQPRQDITIRHVPLAIKLKREPNVGTPTDYHPAKLSSGERKILTVLANYPQGRTKVQVGVIAGYAHDGGAFNNYLGHLRSQRWIEGSQTLQITQAGMSVLGSIDPLPTGKDLLDYWLGRLGKAERMILNALYHVYPQSLGKEAVGSRTGYAPDGGSFNNAIGKLRTLELIHGGAHNLKASDEFFI
jgi:hypothetical protein